jgi:hypothetical protein
VGLLLFAAPAWLAAQALNLKPGAWEITTQGSMLPRAIVEKECITKSDLAQFGSGPDKDDDASCKPVKPPSVAGNKWSTERRCADGRSVRAEFVAESPERVVGSVVASPAKGGAPMTVQINGRWLGASCAGIPQ